MSHRPPPTSRWTTWLGVRAFVVVGMLLAAGAVALPLWWLTRPPVVSQAQGTMDAGLPVLLPETPLLADLPGAEERGQPDPAPRPTSESNATTHQSPTRSPERLVIPAIDLDAPIVPVGWATIEVGSETVGQWQVPGSASVGWHNASAGLGQPGNTVLNGHHNLYGQVFRRLVELEEGDDLWLWTGKGQYTYEVVETVILPEKDQPVEVRLSNAERILPTEDERITLVTCWPYSGNSHRLVVVAKPVRYDLDLGLSIE